ncbi:unnamed protein product [Amaranthus hypochondriacus]
MVEVGIEVIQLYQDTLFEGLRPEKLAYVAVILACVHRGQVHLGLSYIESRIHDFRLDTGPEQFSFVDDLIYQTGAGFLRRQLNVMAELQVQLWQLKQTTL